MPEGDLRDSLFPKLNRKWGFRESTYSTRSEVVKTGCLLSAEYNSLKFVVKKKGCACLLLMRGTNHAIYRALKNNSDPYPVSKA
jgi:hypothetical protein